MRLSQRGGKAGAFVYAPGGLCGVEIVLVSG